MLENIRGHSRGSIPPLRMPSPLPHDLCHEWNVSRRLPAVRAAVLSEHPAQERASLPWVRGWAEHGSPALPWSHSDGVCVCVLVDQSCLTLCYPMDCSLPDSSVHGIFQARVLEWVVISFSRGSSRPRDWTWISYIASKCCTIWATRETGN